MALTLRTVPFGFRVFIITLLVFAFFLGIPVFHYVIAVMIAIIINAFRDDPATDGPQLNHINKRRLDSSIHQAAATD